ncbi:MAG: flagellar hook-associated protein 1 FlgK [Pirellulaceae bacterium]|jgi:flagellar hook-associated protein 1 FlgK
MSLIGTLHIANNSLIAAQIGIQVAGNNLANANPEGYVRQEAVFQPAPTQQFGDLRLGLGVQVKEIASRSDVFLDERLRNAKGDVAFSDAQETAYLELESLLGELTDSDLSSSLVKFFGNIHDVLNQPDELPLRSLAIDVGDGLTRDFHRIANEVTNAQRNNDREIAFSVNEINAIFKEISRLNSRVVSVEASASGNATASGLRNERGIHLKRLAELLDVRVVEQANGSVGIFNGGEYFVFDSEYRELKLGQSDDGRQELHFADTDVALRINAGRIGGLISARDEVFGGFLKEFEEFTKTFIFEFNKVYSNGQGLSGFERLAGEYGLEDRTAALDQAGLLFTPENGSFQVEVYNSETETVETTDIFVKLNGLDDDTTLESLAGELNAIDGITVSITPDNHLEFVTDSSHLEFGFASDTSGALAALGINTFFNGADSGGLASANIGVSQYLQEDSSKFAASLGGVGVDTGNVERLATLYDDALENHQGNSLADLYENFVGDVAQGSAVTRSVAAGYRSFERTLEGQSLAISGVSIDEEAINMISYQRAYQASARLIATISELLDVLVSL